MKSVRQQYADGALEYPKNGIVVSYGDEDDYEKENTFRHILLNFAHWASDKVNNFEIIKFIGIPL